MHGADPATEQRVPFSEIADEQQSSPVSPGILPQPDPPHCPQAESQQTPSSSIPEKPLLQVLFDSITSAFRPKSETDY